MKVKLDFSFICILLSLAFQSASVLLGKHAALVIEEFSLLGVGTNLFYLLSLACLVLQALTWQVVLRKYPLAFAYFIMSLLPVVILLASYFVFNEQVSVANVVGCCIIVWGLVVLTRNDKVESSG
jgi:drug/metabolite transporter (DMT)-like permease